MIFLEAIVKMPLMELPVRSVYVPVTGGAVLISPGSTLKEEQYASLPGPVTDIVAPNLFHCAGVMKAHEHFPQARLWVVPGGHVAKPEIPWTHTLEPESWPYQDELALIPLKGIPKVNECVFVHRDSKSLIIADLCFNLTKANGFGAWLILNIFGTYRKLAMSRFFARFIEDKAGFQKSVDELLKYDFDQIVVGHGDNIIQGGRQVLKSLLHARGF